MHVLLMSPGPWQLPGAAQLAGQHRLTQLAGEPGQLQARLLGLQPDLVLMRGYAAGPALVEQIEALCSALPGMALVLLAADPAPAFLMAVMRAGVREVIPSDEEPVLAGLLARMQARQGTRGGQVRPGRCTGVLPAKGGDGASCLAANLAAAVAARAGQRVLLIDLSLPFGDVELYLTQEEVTSDLAGVCEQIERLDAQLLAGLTQHLGCGLQFIGAPATLEKYLRLEPAHVQGLIRLALRHYDHVFLDLGLEAIGLGVLDMLDQLLLVGSASLPSVKGAAARLALWDQLGHSPDKLQLVWRQAGPAAGLSLADVASALGRPLARQIPQDPQGVAASLAQGRPLVALRPRCELAQALAAWADELSGQAGRPTQEKSLWHRFRNR